MTTLSKVFSSLGISEKAQRVFEIVARRGPVSASNIAQELSMPRATVYVALNNLQQLNLIAVTGSNKRQRFIAEQPRHLVSALENKVKYFQDLIPSAQKISNQLENTMLSRAHALPQLKFFKGLDGIKKVLDSTLTSRSKEVLGIIPAFSLYEALGEEYLQHLIARRVKKSVSTRNIWPSEPVPSMLQKHPEQLRSVRFSETQKIFRSSFITFDDYVIIITSLEEMFSIQIQSHDLAQAMRALFELMWTTAKE